MCEISCVVVCVCVDVVGVGVFDVEEFGRGDGGGCCGGVWEREVRGVVGEDDGCGMCCDE